MDIKSVAMQVECAGRAKCARHVAPLGDHAPPSCKFWNQVGRPVMTMTAAASSHFSDILFKIAIRQLLSPLEVQESMHLL